MARPLRLQFPGAVYHLTARGNARQDIYLDDTDRYAFLCLLGREVQQQRWHCYAYCLMSNHYHLLIETPEGNLVSGMRRLNGQYSQAFNRQHGRVGHVFQGRYTSIVVDRAPYLLELCRYIVLNPVRAHLVRAVGDWPWSSYQATVGLTAAPAWLAVESLLHQFAPTRAAAQAQYRQFVAAGVHTPSPWTQLQGQMWLGDAVFLARMDTLVQGQTWSEVPAVQRQPLRPTVDEVLQHVCDVYGVAREELLTRVHQPAFQAAIYLLRRAANLPLKEVAALGGVSPSRVSHIQRAIEHGTLPVSLQRIMEHYHLTS